VQSPADATSPYNLIQEMPVVAVREGGLPRKQLGPQPPHAFLKIADGCNHNCSFCAIPSFKGRLRSVQREILIAEAKLLLSRGVKEINLVAQDTSDYGKDLYGRDYGIAELISDISALPGDFWIRLFYFYPGGLNARFLEAFQASSKVCRYIDMPLQHLHPDVLHRMKRPHREIKTLEALENLRVSIPGLALRTTFITGFPGETNEQFDYLLEGAKRLRFNRLGAFPFSEEEGTPSALMADQVPRRLRKARYDHLMRAQQPISLELNRAMIGKEIKVLIESQIEEDQWVGRSEFDAPDVDGAVAIHSREALRPGQFAMARVVAADYYDLVAEA
jgi:ribosomal protein S12 methylthiotransferase